MIQIPILNVPNQSFSITIGDNRYVFDFVSIPGGIAYSINRNGEYLIQGCKLLSNVPLLLYPRFADGNFYLTTEFDAIPDYSQFGVTQFLYYLTSEEIANAGA